MAWFFIGLCVGVLLTVPLVAWTCQRTERRVQRLAQRARAAERLAELGKLTGGLAHEIKNPLSTINLNMQLLQEDLGELKAQLGPARPDDDERLGRVQRRLAALSRETQRLRDILEDFLRFAGQMRLDLADTDVNALIDELVDFFTPQAQAAGVRLRTRLAAQPAVVRADVGLLKQAILNLLINATQAMTDARQRADAAGGNDELIVQTQNARVGGQEELLIDVIDTGPGISPEQQEKVFHPYVSTKKGGTGLGLPTARRIVEEHGGTIHLHSEPGRGSDFTITLPLVPNAAGPATGAAADTEG